MAEEEDDPFVREIRRQAERTKRARQLGFWQGLGLVGTVGWMVSLPGVLGALGGRWLDARCHTGIHWTLGLLVVGVALGCLSAWRHVRQELTS
jgi:ATP synthase protein I